MTNKEFQQDEVKQSTCRGIGCLAFGCPDHTVIMSDYTDVTFWDRRYEQANIPWDLGGPSPPFARWLRAGHMTPGKMLVLGAGRGHDARLFAQAGFAVTAVDFSETAVAAMRALTDPNLPLDIVQADMFDLPAGYSDSFDYVLEYTCYCAIDPARRPDYADLVQRLLKPGGQFVALAFPLWDKAGGPPFAVSVAEMVRLFSERGFHLAHREQPPDSVGPRQGNEELIVLVKKS
ncbi:MAG: methyltransferase domain-containing protein [Chloroflexota bacterium]